MVDGDADGEPNDRLRARGSESRTKLWLYMEADRHRIVALASTLSVLPLLAYILRETEQIEDVTWADDESR